MHTSEGLELESETSPAGRFWFLYWRPAQLQGVRPANRAGRDLLWHPQDIARAMPSLLRSPPNTNRGRECTASAIWTSQYPKNPGRGIIESKSSTNAISGCFLEIWLLVQISNIGCHKTETPTKYSNAETRCNLYIVSQSIRSTWGKMCMMILLVIKHGMLW